MLLLYAFIKKAIDKVINGWWVVLRGKTQFLLKIIDF
jgi:hypothetical protein